MVLRILESVVTSAYFPSSYVIHIAIGLLSLYVLRVISQGRKTDRERDLHARIILVTGGFTSTGLTLLQELAEKGAHIIALTPDDIDDTNGRVSILVELLRSTTNNEKIFAEQCDLASPASIRSFCTRFLTGQEQRLDAIIFAHELEHIGSPAFLSTSKQSINDEHRDAGSLATFLITTLLLPALLVAPVERDIRIINVVNPFYAAAAGLPFSPSFPSISGSPDRKAKTSMLLSEGRRSLQSIILNRHFQRVLDALPTGAQVPKTEEGTTAVPVVSSKHQKSNIVAISVCPGFSRVDTIAPLLNADWTSRHGFSKFGVFMYILLHPILRITSKTPRSAIQTILHALYLPTPFKILSNVKTADKKDAPSPIDASQLDMPLEVLRPGALYRECAMVSLNVKVSEEILQEENKLVAERAKNKGKGKEKQKDSKSSAPLQEEVLDIADDGEYGGELAGRLVWETYEQSLKTWEKNNLAPVIEEPKPQPPKPKDPNASFY